MATRTIRGWSFDSGVWHLTDSSLLLSREGHEWILFRGAADDTGVRLGPVANDLRAAMDRVEQRREALEVAEASTWS